LQRKVTVWWLGAVTCLLVRTRPQDWPRFPSWKKDIDFARHLAGPDQVSIIGSFWATSDFPGGAISSRCRGHALYHLFVWERIFGTGCLNSVHLSCNFASDNTIKGKSLPSYVKEVVLKIAKNVGSRWASCWVCIVALLSMQLDGAPNCCVRSMCFPGEWMDESFYSRAIIFRDSCMTGPSVIGRPPRGRPWTPICSPWAGPIGPIGPVYSKCKY